MQRQLLARHPLFGELQPRDLERLASHLRQVHRPARTVLFRKGDPGTNMMVVVRGRVKVCTYSEEGKELVLNLFGPGGVVGGAAQRQKIGDDGSQGNKRHQGPPGNAPARFIGAQGVTNDGALKQKESRGKARHADRRHNEYRRTVEHGILHR